MKATEATIGLLSLLLFAVAASAQNTPTPGLSETVGVPDPPKSPAVPPAGVSGPTLDQTLQWMSETAPQNPISPMGENPGLVTYVVPGSTCSKTGFELVSYTGTKAIPSFTDWMVVNLGGIDPASVIATGDDVAFSSSQAYTIALKMKNRFSFGWSAASVIKAYRQGKTLKIKTVEHRNSSLGFGTPEYSFRFANALKHAVKMCGGKSAPPTGQPF